MAKRSAPKQKKVDPAVELASQMLAVLQSQRGLGAGAYPPTLARLGELCEQPPKESLVAAASKKLFKDETIVSHKEGSKPALDALVFLKASVDDDRERGAIAAKLLSNALKGSSSDEGFAASQLVKKVPTALKKLFPTDLEREAVARRLPLGVHSISCGAEKSRKRYFFVLDGPAPGANGHVAAPHVHAHTPAAEPPRVVPAAPPAGFGLAFAEAFDRLDRQQGRRNFLKLLELRRALPQFDRAGFDAGLNQLRRERSFSLAPHEGLEGVLTPDEREAGISEAGNLWAYVLRVMR